MRILVCNWKDLAHPRAGGAEVWTQGVASAWTAMGHDVTLACASAPGLADIDERDGVVIMRGGDYRTGVHAHARRIYERCRGGFDLVLDEINTRPFRALRWARSSTVVAFVHQVAREVWFHETPLPLALAGRFALEPRWLRGYRSVPMFTPSESTAESLRLYGIEHAVALPQCADLPDPPAASASDEKETRPTFVFVGRLCSMKRPEHVVRAFRIVQRAVPDAQLWIIGTGRDEARLRRHAGCGVELLGHLASEERDRYVARVHALITTSVREGWGLVVSEAAAVGTGTISYHVPGLVDAVSATGGELVAPHVDALAAAMRRVARDPSSAPRPTSTGVVPFETVARALLADAEVSSHA
jgi:glycosyltransferase involved in cell wall biosynthesis